VSACRLGAHFGRERGGGGGCIRECSSTWDSGGNSAAFCLGQRKMTEVFGGDGWSQDVPDARCDL
jgi:hypothetical protein